MIATSFSVLLLGTVLAAFVVIGVRAGREGPRADLDDFTVARGSQGPLTLGLSFLASGLGAWILFAPPELGAILGIGPVIGYAVAAAGPFLVFAFVGPRLRRIVPSGQGLSEFLRVRFGRSASTLVTARLAAVHGRLRRGRTRRDRRPGRTARWDPASVHRHRRGRGHPHLHHVRRPAGLPAHRPVAGLARDRAADGRRRRRARGGGRARGQRPRQRPARRRPGGSRERRDARSSPSPPRTCSTTATGSGSGRPATTAPCARAPSSAPRSRSR